MKNRRIIFALFMALAIALCAFFAFSEEAYVKTMEEAETYLLGEVMSGKTEIRMKADPVLHDMLSDQYNVFDLFSSAKIATAFWSFEEGELYIYDMTAYPESIYCESMEDAIGAFERCHPSVILHLSKAFYDEFARNEFEQFHSLNELALIESSDGNYYAETRFFIYDNIKYVGNTVYIDSVEALEKHISECAQKMQTSISYTLSDNMYDMVCANTSIEYEMYAVNGIYTYDMYVWDEYKKISIENIVYYPGTKIIRALENNALDTLNEEETKLYETALSISEKAVKETADKPNREIQLELALIREIAERCTYVTGEDVHNTAIGALLYGTADCDGYSDALYLLGNLSGLTVYYQLGNMMDGGSHMWNLVCADGNRHFTDVAGCDMNLADAHEAIRPEWMGMGRETAQLRYIYQPVSQIIHVDGDNEWILDAAMEGYVFESVEEARAYLETCTDDWTQFVIKGIDADNALETCTDDWTQFVIKGIDADNAQKAAEDSIYGYGGPYYSWLWDDKLHVVLAGTWFSMDHFYDCCSLEDVRNAFLKKQTDVVIRLSEEMYADFLADGGAALNQTEREAGVLSKELSYYDSTRVFLYSDVTYNP